MRRLLLGFVGVVLFSCLALTLCMLGVLFSAWSACTWGDPEPPELRSVCGAARGVERSGTSQGMFLFSTTKPCGPLSTESENKWN